jgi:hypothetical protein
MLTGAESYFESDERGPDSLMRTDDRADALSRYFELVSINAIVLICVCPAPLSVAVREQAWHKRLSKQTPTYG